MTGERLKAGVAATFALSAGWLLSPSEGSQSFRAPQDPVRVEGETLVSRGHETPSSPEFVPGEILVTFKQGADLEQALASRRSPSGRVRLPGRPDFTALCDRFGVTRIERPFGRKRNGRLRLRRPGTANRIERAAKLVSEHLRNDSPGTLQLLAALKKNPTVEHAELNVMLEAHYVPDDPFFLSGGAWGQTFQDLWGLHQIQAEQAWDISQGAGVVVAVLDTGLDYGHEDISANVWQNPGEIGLDGLSRDKRTNGVDDDGNGFVDDWRGWDFVSLATPSGDNDPLDDHGHGTHVAGTIAAVADNGLGVVGVAPQASILPVKVLNQGGSGTVA